MSHKRIFGIILALMLGCVQMASGEPAASSLRVQNIENLVNDYYAQKALEESQSAGNHFEIFQTPHRDPRCDEPRKPGIGSCIDVVCNRLPSYECDSDSDLKEIAGICRNNFDGKCIKTMCSRLPSYECDSKSDIKEIAQYCSNTSSQCVESVCGRLYGYECDSHSDMKEVAMMCQGLIDGSCVEAVCNRLPAYKCDSKSDMAEVIKTCKNN